MIGQLRSVAVDCQEPKVLAEFYSGLIGGPVEVEDETWVVAVNFDRWDQSAQ